MLRRRSASVRPRDRRDRPSPRLLIRLRTAGWTRTGAPLSAAGPAEEERCAKVCVPAMDARSANVLLLRSEAFQGCSSVVGMTVVPRVARL